MTTISLKLPRALAVKLAAAARRQGTSKSALIREALESYFAQGDGAHFVSCYDLAADLAGSVDSGVGDLSYNKKRMEGYGR